MATRFDDWEGDFLAHHGIKGQKWGIRRYQNPDGTLTEAGKKHEQKVRYKEIKNIYKQTNAHRRKTYDTEAYEQVLKHVPKESIERILPYDREYDKAASRSAEYANQLKRQYSKAGPSSKKSDQIRVQKEMTKLADLKKKEWDALSKWDKASTAETEALLGKYGNRKMPKATSESAKQFVRYAIEYYNWQTIDNERKKSKQKGWREDHG